MLRRHSKRTEDKSRASKTSLRLQTKWQGQTSEAKARHKLRVRQVQPCFAFGSLSRPLSWSYQIPQVQSPVVCCSNSLYDDAACKTQLS